MTLAFHDYNNSITQNCVDVNFLIPSNPSRISYSSVFNFSDTSLVDSFNTVLDYKQDNLLVQSTQSLPSQNLVNSSNELAKTKKIIVDQTINEFLNKAKEEPQKVIDEVNRIIALSEKGKLKNNPFIRVMINKNNHQPPGLVIRVCLKLQEHANEIAGAKSYERTSDRRFYRDGYIYKTIKTLHGLFYVAEPRFRTKRSTDMTQEIIQYDAKKHNPGCFTGKYKRQTPSIDLQIQQDLVNSVSERDIQKKLINSHGVKVSRHSTRACNQKLEEKSESFIPSKLPEVDYLFIDGTYTKYEELESTDTLNNKKKKKAKSACILLAYGLNKGQKKARYLGSYNANNENEAEVSTFISELVHKGLKVNKLIISDDGAALKKALDQFFPGIDRQRCQFHLLKNVKTHVSKKINLEQIHPETKAIFKAPNKESALNLLNTMITKWEVAEPKFALWARDNIPQGLTVYDHASILEAFFKKLTTNNTCERQNREFKKKFKYLNSCLPSKSCLNRLTLRVIYKKEFANYLSEQFRLHQHDLL